LYITGLGPGLFYIFSQALMAKTVAGSLWYTHRYSVQKYQSQSAGPPIFFDFVLEFGNRLTRTRIECMLAPASTSVFTLHRGLRAMVQVYWNLNGSWKRPLGTWLRRSAYHLILCNCILRCWCFVQGQRSQSILPELDEPKISKEVQDFHGGYICLEPGSTVPG